MILTLVLAIVLVLSIGVTSILIARVVSKIIDKKFNLERSIREGIKSAYEEMEYKKEQESSFLKENRKSHRNLGIYSSTNDSGPVISDGDLIPFDATEEEKELLRMFYYK